MKSIKTKLILAAVGVMTASSAIAQNTYSGYFLDNYDYRYEMNPAFGNEKAFLGFPALGNLNIGMQGNLHMRNLLYNIDGKTCLFTNPGVSAQEVLSGIHDKNRLGADVKINVINFGFKALGGYNTIGINVKANAEAHIPGSLFSLLKEGVSNQDYDISNLRARATSYGEIALNHSHDIKTLPGLRVGGTLKFLIGVGRVDASMKQANLQLGEDSWNIQADALIQASVNGLKYKLKHNKDADRDYVNGADIDNFGLNGFGMGVDLGAEYKWHDFNFSAAVLDLGFINWNNTATASTCGVREFQTSRYEFDLNDDNAGQSEWDNMRDDLTALYQLDDLGNTGSRTTALAATLNFGVQYTFPLYRPLSFGLVNSTRLQGDYTWTDFRLSANVRPVKCFSASANMSVNTFGTGFGWLLNYSFGGGNIFVGMDHTMGKLAKQCVPLNSNAKFNFGINFPL